MCTRRGGVGFDEREANRHIDVAEDCAPNHLRRIAELCAPYLGRRVLDVGAGTGAVTERFAEGRELVAVELSQWCLDALHARFAGHENVTVVESDLRTLHDPDGFDSAVMINVLEHLADDVGALRHLARLVRPGGRIVVYVPAFNGLYGEFDRRAGHYRRYATWRLGAVMDEAGLRPLTLRYLNALAIPAWMVLTHSKRVAERPAGGLEVWDRVGVPVSRAVESRMRLPFGLNVLGVGSTG